MPLNYYQILKVDTDATFDQIRNSYQQLHQLWSSRKMNEKELKLLKEAFETLSNPSKRKEYDRQLINEMGGNMKKEIDFYLGYEKDVNNYINESDYELERLEDEIRIKFRIPFVEKFIKLIKEHQKAPPGTFEERIYRWIIKNEKRNENKINKLIKNLETYCNKVKENITKDDTRKKEISEKIVQITQEIVTELKTEPQISDERLNKLEDGKYKKWYEKISFKYKKHIIGINEEFIDELRKAIRKEREKIIKENQEKNKKWLTYLEQLKSLKISLPEKRQEFITDYLENLEGWKKLSSKEKNSFIEQVNNSKLEQFNTILKQVRELIKEKEKITIPPVVEKKEDRKSEPKEPNKPCPTEQENKKEKIELSDSDIIISINLRWWNSDYKKQNDLSKIENKENWTYLCRVPRFFSFLKQNSSYLVLIYTTDGKEVSEIRYLAEIKNQKLKYPTEVSAEFKQEMENWIKKDPTKRKKEYLACQIKHLYKLTNPIKREAMKSQYGINYQGLRLYTYCSKSPELQQALNSKKIKIERIF